MEIKKQIMPKRVLEFIDLDTIIITLIGVGNLFIPNINGSELANFFLFV